MVPTITSVAFAVRNATKSSSTPIILNHAQQLVAAALGYTSFHSLKHSDEGAIPLSPRGHYVLHELLVIRARELHLPHGPEEVVTLIKAAFSESLPLGRVHTSNLELTSFLRRSIEEHAAKDVDVRFFVNLTNDISEEIDFELEEIAMADLPPRGTAREIDIPVQISIDRDADRPDSGRTLDLEAVLFLERLGRSCIAEPRIEILGVEPNYELGRAMLDMHRAPPEVSLAQALADYLHLSLEEAEELTDAEIQSNESDDGMVYSYFFDFSSYASAGVAQKIREQHGGLRIELPPSFFHRVSSPIE